MIKENLCFLCGSNKNQPISGPLQRSYRKCLNCGLVYVTREFFIPEKEAHRRYLKHENTPDSIGYTEFLRKAVNPVLPFIERGSKALDFGCGHQPVLAGILESLGVECDYYDPLFFPEGIKKISYDFIFSTETFEHFQNPAREISLIYSLLARGGYLSVMTKFLDSEINFSSWYYAMDPTHLTFYGTQVFSYIAEKWSFSIFYMDSESLVVFKKK